MSTGLAYGLTGLLGLALGLTNARKQAREDTLLESKLRGPGTWEPVPGPDDRSWLAKLLSAGLAPGDIEISPGRRYRHTPYGKTTEEDVRSLGLTTPVSHPTPYAPSPKDAFSPVAGLDMTQAFQYPEAQGLVPPATHTYTTDEPMQAFVGIPKDPATRRTLLLERLRAQRKERPQQQAEAWYQSRVAPIVQPAGGASEAPPGGAPGSSAAESAPVAEPAPVGTPLEQRAAVLDQQADALGGQMTQLTQVLAEAPREASPRLRVLITVLGQQHARLRAQAKALRTAATRRPPAGP